MWCLTYVVVYVNDVGNIIIVYYATRQHKTLA